MVVQELGRIARICSHSHLFVFLMVVYGRFLFIQLAFSTKDCLFSTFMELLRDRNHFSKQGEGLCNSIGATERKQCNPLHPAAFIQSGLNSPRPPFGLSRHSFGWHPLLTTLIAVVPPSLAHGLYSTWAEGLVRFRGGLGFGLGIEIGFGFGLRAWGRVGVTDTHWVMIGSGFQLGIQIQLGLWLRLGLEFALGSGLGIGIGKWLGFGFGFGCTQFGLAVQLWAEGK